MRELLDTTLCHCCGNPAADVFDPEAWLRATCPGCNAAQWFCGDCVDDAVSGYYPADRPIQHGMRATSVPAYSLGCSGCLGCVGDDVIRPTGPLNPDAWWIDGQRVENLSGQWWHSDEWGS